MRGAGGLVREGGRAPIGIKGARKEGGGRRSETRKRNGVARRRAASGGLLLSVTVDGLRGGQRPIYIPYVVVARLVNVNQELV